MENGERLGSRQQKHYTWEQISERRRTEKKKRDREQCTMYLRFGVLKFWIWTFAVFQTWHRASLLLPGLCGVGFSLARHLYYNLYCERTSCSVVSNLVSR